MMASEHILLMMLKQQDLIERYDTLIANQNALIKTLWTHIYMLSKFTLTTQTAEPKRADLLAMLSYAALCMGRSQEAIAAANEGLEAASDASMIRRLMHHLEQAQNEASV
jgi:hypothetical protein